MTPGGYGWKHETPGDNGWAWEGPCGHRIRTPGSRSKETHREAVADHEATCPDYEPARLAHAESRRSPAKGGEA